MKRSEKRGANVIVIGAGIVGMAAAYFLRSAGHSVTVLDADTPMAGATGASDGAVSVASKKPGVMMVLAKAARDFYVQLEADGLLRDLFHRRPTFMFARNELEANVLAAHGADLAKADVQVDELTVSEFARRIPGVSRNVVSVLAVPGDGHALGYQIVAHLLKLSDVTVVRHARAKRVRVENGKAVGVETDSGFFCGDAVLVAAGLGSADLVGLGNFICPRKGQIIITDREKDNEPALEGPLMSAAYLAAKRNFEASRKNPISLVIDPLRTGQFLIGGTREEGVDSRTTTAHYVSEILRQAMDIYPAMGRRRVIRTFSGVRTATVDGLPVVGFHPAITNVFVATGFEGDGICLGPLIGKTSASLMTGKQVDLDIASLSPSRFVSREGTDEPQPTAAADETINAATTGA
ncbi:NAD(P)/FAD-dependent oxidoreductase [Paraburkholderia susongensis]|uniref:Glycine/D-amino acid oxidase n=1 Tax=Paraburkholderia susongensis TaxID=1515439 RepID=A0A1X7LQP9_9BURK|nr:FAD-binding oxidoreductase [Paraburkholderia susongensis]SMG55582.1 Glycine/D-amino acid oxidase [Paraburkholderia susongensis]